MLENFYLGVLGGVLGRSLLYCWCFVIFCVAGISSLRGKRCDSRNALK